MSISRKNWMALSSLARQRARQPFLSSSSFCYLSSSSFCYLSSSSSSFCYLSSSSFCYLSSSSSSFCYLSSSSSSTRGGSGEVPHPQQNKDLVELLRSRDEKRKKRQTETLRRQQGEQEGGRARGETSVCISLDPTPPPSPGLPWTSPCHSPSPRGPWSPGGHNGYAQECECTTYLPEDPSQKDDRNTNFQRNTRQRVSSRSIQEKMDRLAQAAQRSEVSRSPDVTQRTLVLLEEVSRKRDLFEKEHQGASSPSSPRESRQEFSSFSSAISDRINRWVNKGGHAGSSPNPADLRHVDISSKKILFESKQTEHSMLPHGVRRDK
ncbi:hypothetical protein NHX12_012619 [Muraenolepis orangiensis]|uniref:Uncharacterized protein n=1 Tax=Muraenolepis orangiensis TaxID=630683 RepID=A0A9Q0DCB4_9TELE|nr:hypothetical protein NHX12_012619 [Muraenolepis orangiensis]